MRTNLANVPIWVTENNVNADYDNGNGMSNCIPGQKFVLDPRGTSAFHYLRDRIGGARQISSLADLIQQRANTLQLGSSWDSS